VAYKDFRHYLAVLEAHGKLRRVAAPVDPAWEIAAVVRRVFERYPDATRPALLFEQVQGATMPVAVGVLGGSRAIYALAMETTVDDIAAKWARAQAAPLPPVEVASGPCQEVVRTGAEVDLRRLPAGVWTPDADPGSFLTAPCVVSVDPDTGERNVGTYRCQIKGPDRMGLVIGWTTRGMWPHMVRNEARDQPTPCAIVLGPDPPVALASVSPLPQGMDEIAVAGAIRGEPVPLVRCRTNDLLVPAAAEIVIEGEVLPGMREAEGPFGDYTGYVDAGGEAPVVRVTAITHRRDPIFHAFFSQMPPSESSVIRGTGREGSLLKKLTDLGLPVTDVHLLHAGGAAAILALAIRKEEASQPQQVMWAAWAADQTLGKITIVVDDDVDIRSEFMLFWALSWTVQPERDTYLATGTHVVPLDPSQQSAPPSRGTPGLSSKLGIDATRKHAYPPRSGASAADLARVDARWAEYGLD
jgi:UbiD family decarboxylase